MMSNKNQGIQDYKIFLSMLDKYEELNLTNYVDGDDTKMVFGSTKEGGGEGALKESVGALCENLRNPYLNLYHWVKGEVFDIDSVSLALAKRDEIKLKINKTDKTKKKTEAGLENVNAGKKSMSTLLKTADDAPKMANKIEMVSKN